MFYADLIITRYTASFHTHWEIRGVIVGSNKFHRLCYVRVLYRVKFSESVLDIK